MRERLPPCAPEAGTPARGRLPTETEWEFAARHPHIGWVETPKLYPWGDEAPSNETEWRLNLWQGDFPRTDAALDGHAGLAPADAFEPNAAGLYNMLGALAVCLPLCMPCPHRVRGT